MFFIFVTKRDKYTTHFMEFIKRKRKVEFFMIFYSLDH